MFSCFPYYQRKVRHDVRYLLSIISMFAVASLLQVLIFFAKLRHRKEQQASLGAMRRKIDGSLPQIKIWVFRQFFRALLALFSPLMPSCFARKLSTCKKSFDFTKGKSLRFITS